MDFGLIRNSGAIDSLVRRIQMGPGACTVNEWEAYSWLCQMFTIPIYNRSLPQQGTYMLADRIRRENANWGSWSIEVPIDQRNPERPQIVNRIMLEIGMRKVEQIFWSKNTVDGAVPISVTYTYSY